MEKQLTIGIVAGELSGDLLGEGLIKAIRRLHPNARFIGIGGPKMMAQGCESLYDMEVLSVMGLVEVLGRLPSLLKVKKGLVAHFTEYKPDVFIGIDAPDFNLRIEQSLKSQGIKTVHYVSPSVWAWRQSRIVKIKAATDLVLALLPFEKEFYDEHQAPCEFVGHTLADAIELHTDKIPARCALNLEQDRRWVAVLPGSRGGELKYIAKPFIEACQQIAKQAPDVGFVVALVNAKRRAQFERIWQKVAPELDFVLIDGTAREVIAAADVVMLASGTVALECMLINRPMVVGYKVHPLTAYIVGKMLKTPYVSLPNILAKSPLVKELLQDDCTAQALSTEVMRLLNSDNETLTQRFTKLHQVLRKDSDKQAAKAVLALLGDD